MGRSLVIVESPAKAKTINKYLGKDFIVKSSVGHVRDLPTSGSASTSDPKERAKQAALTRKMSPEKKAIYKARKAKEQLINRMGIDPENGWEAHYQILPGKEKVVDELKRLAKDADQIYLATDLDREGEAIAWHLREIIGGQDEQYRRVVFNEITKKAIQKAFEQPSDLNMNRVNAQQARRFLDRVVGFMLSPLLWSKIARGLSAGRVQSVAVRLIVEREREIRAFIPEEFWEAFANLSTDSGEVLRAQLIRYQGKEFRPTNAADTHALIDQLSKLPFAVSKREDKPTSSRPAAPFITSTLQQAASTRMGFSVKKTMTLAQRLYEAGYITYMRTDSTNLSQDAVASVRDYIQDKLGEQYLPDQPRIYSSKAGAQEAHEAIRVSDVTLRAADLSSMEPDAQRLYDLIWRRFVACQTADAKFTSSSITTSAGDFDLKTRGRVIRFDGHLRVLTSGGGKDDDVLLPDVAEGDHLNLIELEPKQHFTKPSPRFSEAALVKELEKRGIGRPSTYASIISTIQERGYVSLKGRRFYAEKMGDIVTSRLVENFDDLMDFGFTASMEEKLDHIADGDSNWTEVLDNFYGGFQKKLDSAGEDGGMRPNTPVDTDIPCPTCGRHMQIRTGSTGVFLGCSGYSLPPKERCTQTLNLIPGEEAISADEDEEAESRRLMEKRRCPICDNAMDSYLLDEQRKVHICGNNPDCVGVEVETGQFKIKGYDGPTLECDKCGSEMQLKSGRFGKYFGCTNSECKNTRKLLKSGEAAPPKMDPVPMPELKCLKVDDTYVLRDGASGLFLAASQFPKNRETRPPQVQELLAHQAELPQKYHFLLDAPRTDKDNNPSVIRYSRKSKEQYVMSEVEGKATGWSAWYKDGQWVEETKKKASPKKTTKAADK
ncbi:MULTISPECIES: type I DNA topoisomerase [unclassified Oceanobacter]|jgi:DNA topoisomerase-1|uniref:type I DNA topoisomerase n=2 Tax=Gammaproteobacteria TaxID=1236 RepID=UPI0026E12911|nr:MULTISPECIES: type I DNA topoisomerase [unclassified Oceanobacter]MDO6683566.1 type I DNA topoisomerase [Oceanobacter sp. 5_MG-2023]MDP2504801.1 type I DNA topoisomerase [Oceanobacter sp. 3_MG-2023]MDP2546244.1 type I DNA topoisomerase [Oceanobacter sp. 4_MG-2023]MDP2607546.1 type I DNA topoisomerase [Oceanobacter sp. 1_MG-2023]MDP2610814.1 type I DNA topoisomerase [Oceanobacter sp. 2_MG-2023]